MNPSPTKLGRVWLVLLAGPVLFLVTIVAASIYFGLATQGDVERIPELVAASTPYQLVAVEVFLLLILRWAIRRDGLTWKDIGWKTAAEQKQWPEMLVGILAGVGLGLLYIYVLSPLLTTVQEALGDYVPAGELLPNLGAAMLPFFIASVLLAPFVEEGIYRGYAITRLRGRFGKVGAVVLSIAFFGLLHWTGGFWYMLLTGVVAGGVFGVLFVGRRNLVAPFAAHLALNITEFTMILLETQA